MNSRLFTTRRRLIAQFFIAAFSIWLVVGISPVHAARTFQDAEGFADTAQKQTFITQTDVGSYLGVLANQAFTLVGTIFFLLMFYAGFLWFTAHGNDDKIDKSKKILTACIIGLVLIVAAYAMTNFIIPAAIRIGSTHAAN